MLWQYRNDKKKLDFFLCTKNKHNSNAFQPFKSQDQAVVVDGRKKNKKTTIEYQIVEPACILHWTKEYVCVTFSRVNE